MNRIIALTILLIATTSVSAQKAKFKVNGLKDTTIFLAKYLGPKLYYADTAESKNGIVTFDVAKHPRGLYAVITPGTRYFEVIFDNEEIDMAVGDLNDMVKSMKINKSKNNKVFYDYIMFMTDFKKKGQTLEQKLKSAEPKDQTKIREQIKNLSEEMREGQEKLYQANKDLFIGTMIKMSMDVKLPEPPRDDEGNITDSNYVYNYYIEHYWDGIDFKDASIVRTPVYHNKLDKYFSKNGLLQIPDTITKYAKWMCDQMVKDDESNEVFKYTVHHITQKYESSKIMGLDKVFVFMAMNYYCEPNNFAYWMTDENLEKLCERANKLSPTMIGNPAPMLILPDTTEKNWVNSHKIEADYTVLYFWDPNCGHCKKTTPKLQHLYEEKFKDRNIEIYAIGKATGEDFEAWKKYIKENELTFINVGLTKSVYEQAMEDPRPLLKHTTIQSLNYSDTYDIYSTPRIFILDKNKIIKFKQLSIGQLEEILDNLTGHEDDEKLYPKEDPENGANPPSLEEEEDH